MASILRDIDSAVYTAARAGITLTLDQKREAIPRPYGGQGQGVDARYAAGTKCPTDGYRVTALIESTWIVLVLAFSVPMTLTFRPANFSGVRWSLSA